MWQAKGKPGWRFWAVLVAAIAVTLVARAWHDTMRDPVTRHLSVAVPMAAGPANPRRIVLLSDLHVAAPDMPPSRLARIAAEVDAMKPDLVLFAGDFVTDRWLATRRYSTRAAVAPLAGLDRRTVRLAVPGNHDHWRDAGELERELARIGIGTLRNEVANVGGLLVAGIDDAYTGHARVGRVAGQLARMGRGGVVLSHSPDPFPRLSADTGLMLAGHTHCGQIGWPWGGAPVTNSRYGGKYACGVIRERGNTLVTSAGLGTSVLPFRLFTQPEIWVIDVRPVATQTAAGSLRRP
ncbi:metallophosphoesterase [Tsuneonella amylolytica]|uniref:metallophosphoesterase n=1 Tax=Tsuneonella amylolytica TaxID=2338327 RepID=UPI000EA976B1|nr:metallophosphoesterase [Tsuneonella amylolytica]